MSWFIWKICRGRFFFAEHNLDPPAHLQHNDIAGWPDPLFMEVRKKFISTAVADFLYCTTIHYLFAILLYYVCQTCRNLRKQTLLLHLISWRENWIRVLAIGGTFLTVAKNTQTNLFLLTSKPWIFSISASYSSWWSLLVRARKLFSSWLDFEASCSKYWAIVLECFQADIVSLLLASLIV